MRSLGPVPPRYLAIRYHLRILLARILNMNPGHYLNFSFLGLRKRYPLSQEIDSQRRFHLPSPDWHCVVEESRLRKTLDCMLGLQIHPQSSGILVGYTGGRLSVLEQSPRRRGYPELRLSLTYLHRLKDCHLSRSIASQVKTSLSLKLTSSRRSRPLAFSQRCDTPSGREPSSCEAVRQQHLPLRMSARCRRRSDPGFDPRRVAKWLRHYLL